MVEIGIVIVRIQIVPMPNFPIRLPNTCSNLAIAGNFTQNGPCDWQISRVRDIQIDFYTYNLMSFRSKS